MSEKRPFTRPVAPHWWARPPYLAYTTRELSGVAVAIYGAFLFAGLFSLWLGPDSYGAFLRFLKTPFSLVLNLLLLAAVAYHVVTWFKTLPKTMPILIVGGKAIPPEEVTRIATRTAGATSLILVLLALWVAR
jgi:fumarate reductase subunit C